MFRLKCCNKNVKFLEFELDFRLTVDQLYNILFNNVKPGKVYYYKEDEINNIEFCKKILINKNNLTTKFESYQDCVNLKFSNVYYDNIYYVGKQPDDYDNLTSSFK